MVTSFYHFNDLTDRRAAVSFLYLSHGLAWVSHMGKNQRKSGSCVRENNF